VVQEVDNSHSHAMDSSKEVDNSHNIDNSKEVDNSHSKDNSKEVDNSLLCKEWIGAVDEDLAERRAEKSRAEPDINSLEDMWSKMRLCDNPNITFNYFNNMQTEIQQHQRKIVIEWMIDVCTRHQREEAEMAGEMLSLSVTYLDRFLSKVNIKKEKFQLLASVCLLLASKFLEANHIKEEQLVAYTDCSIFLKEIREWEIEVLNTLQWKLYTIPARTYAETLLHKMTLKKSSFSLTENLLITIITEFYFSFIKPSLLASAALVASSSSSSSSSLISKLSTLTQHSCESINELAKQMANVQMEKEEQEKRSKQQQ